MRDSKHKDRWGNDPCVSNQPLYDHHYSNGEAKIIRSNSRVLKEMRAALNSKLFKTMISSTQDFENCSSPELQLNKTIW
jgi:hypothetical protein